MIHFLDAHFHPSRQTEATCHEYSCQRARKSLYNFIDACEPIMKSPKKPTLMFQDPKRKVRNSLEYIYIYISLSLSLSLSPLFSSLLFSSHLFSLSLSLSLSPLQLLLVNALCRLGAHLDRRHTACGDAHRCTETEPTLVNCDHFCRAGIGHPGGTERKGRRSGEACSEN